MRSLDYCGSIRRCDVSHGGGADHWQGHTHISTIGGVHFSFLSLQTSNYSGQRRRWESNGEGVSSPLGRGCPPPWGGGVASMGE